MLYNQNPYQSYTQPQLNIMPAPVYSAQQLIDPSRLYGGQGQSQSSSGGGLLGGLDLSSLLGTFGGGLDPSASTPSASTSSSTLGQAMTNEKKKKTTGDRLSGAAGGAMTGASLGSMVAPGIGTAIGALLGGASGAFL